MTDNIKTLLVGAPLLYFFLVTYIVNGENLWGWKCDAATGFCTRTPKGVSATYPSIEVCRLVCGNYGALWPRPTLSIKLGTGLLKFSARSVSVTISAEPPALPFLQENQQYFLNLISKQNTTLCPESNILTIEISVTSPDLRLNWETDESYQIKSTQTQGGQSVKIIANTVFGARHGLETLSQLIDFYPETTGSCLVIVDESQISDRPIYPHRGLLLDTARNFQSVATIKRHINAMAASKLNVLHWHITDSQSFPLELPRLPNMTRFGSYGSSKIYTSADVINVKNFAKSRGVRVVIEIDAPSHSGNGWQWGPDAGLGNLGVCINQQPYRSFCIQPPCGQLNPANQNVYKVLKDLYNDIVDMVPDSELFHMGGDEVYIPCWNSTAEIIQYLGGNTTIEAFLGLWSDFQSKALQAFDAVVGNSNTPIMLWTSHLTEVDVIQKYLSKDRYVIQTWVPAVDELPANLLKLGYRIIVSTKDTWYLDHGFWGSTTYHNWRNVYNNIIPPRGNGTLGGEVCMWGEYVDDNSVESRTWPRAAAAAERLWSNPASKSDVAEPRFYRHRERLVSREINAEALTPKWCYQNDGDCT